MLDVNDDLKISISRGDTGSITITFEGEDVPPDGTVAVFVLQKTFDSERPVWEKELPISDGQVTVPFNTYETNYPRGSYTWCLRLIYENGEVYTPMDKPLDFDILPATGDVG